MDKAAVTLTVGIKLFSILGALVVVITVPLVYFGWHYQRYAGEMETGMEYSAAQIAQTITRKNGEPRLDTNKIKQLLAAHSNNDYQEVHRVLDNDANTVAETTANIQYPLMTRRVPLRFKDEVIGQLETSRSLYQLIYHSIMAGLFSLLLGSLTFAFSWAFPLRALNMAMSEVKVRQQTENNLSESLSLLGATLESTADAILVTDRYGVVVRFNNAYKKMWGLDDEKESESGQAFANILEKLENRYTFLHRLKKLRQNPDIESHDNLALSNGQFVECSSRPQKVQGVTVGRVWSFRDITHQKQSEALIIAENNVLEMIATGAKLPYILDMLTRYMEERDNSLFCAIFLLDESGTELKIASAQSLPQDLISSLEGPISQRGIAAITAGKDRGEPVVTMDNAHDSLWSRHRDFAFKVGLQSTRLCPIVASNGNLLGVLTAYFKEEEPLPYEEELIKVGAKLAGIAVERILTEQHLDYMAHYDALTQLPNRILLQDRLERMAAMARRNKEMVAMMFIDLDRFKKINDTLGHALGDELLKKIATRLKRCVREEDTIARLGGDEFVAVLAQIKQTEDVAHIAQKILHAVEQKIELDTQDIYISASIGISIFPADTSNMDNLLKNADTAMYQAKAQGRNTYHFYSADMNALALEQLDLENRLRTALEREELLLYYQPIIDPKLNRIAGMEALLRWQHPDKGTIAPDKFIPILEDTGLILPVGEWVLRTACIQAKAWHNIGADHLRVGVNISPRQFKDKVFPQTVKRILQQTGIDPQLLELEITESLLIEDANHAASQISQLKELGIRDIAIDDFGVGYSSLSYLSTLPISTVKLDKLFVDGLPHEKSNAAIAKAVLAMVHHLGLRLIAEGVENKEQLSFLVEQNCDEIQGYYFSQPLPADEFERFLMTPRLVESVHSSVAGS